MHREDAQPAPGAPRNGTPRTNPNLAPSCGATTRAGCACRSPAMANGRCRMHGGAGTGPTTPAGRTHLRLVRTKHGFYKDDTQDHFRHVNAFIADTRALLKSIGQGIVPLDALLPHPAPIELPPISLVAARQK